MPYKDPQRAIEYRKAWQSRNTSKKRKWLNEYKKDKPCSHCGETYEPLYLDLHHIDPAKKKANISNLVQGTRSLETLKEEVAKCEIICAHCHRLHHYKETN
jgi:endonuclease I